jgi:solute carrier family 27 fatty acid transporter 1/4
VSTVEVESVISSVLEQADSVVYGVDVPGIEGKAGMAAIVEEADKFDLERFLNRIRAELPAYAIPLFIRIVSTIDITGRVLNNIKYFDLLFGIPKLWYNQAVTYFRLVSK